jgi:hypothetical protein
LNGRFVIDAPVWIATDHFEQGIPFAAPARRLRTTATRLPGRPNRVARLRRLIGVDCLEFSIDSGEPGFKLLGEFEDQFLDKLVRSDVPRRWIDFDVR